MKASRLAVAVARLGARAWRRLSFSLPLCLGATVFFARLASELREGQLDAFDEPIQRWVESARGTSDTLMLTCTWAGGMLPMTLLTLGVLVVLVLRRRLREARFLALAAAGSLLLSVLLKAGFHRARPRSSWFYVLPTPSSFSFPSGHTMGSAGVVSGLLVLLWLQPARRRTKITGTVIGVAFVVGVGVSRIYFGVHYPSDVLGGWLAVTAWVSAVTGWMYPKLLPGT